MEQTGNKRLYYKAYYQQHREQCIARSRKWQRSHDYYNQHKEHIQEVRKAWVKRHPYFYKAVYLYRIGKISKEEYKKMKDERD